MIAALEFNALFYVFMKLKIPQFAHVLIGLSLTIVSCQSNDPATEGSNTRINEKQVSSSSQRLSQPDFDASAEVKEAKVTAPGELLLRTLQFEAPYRGYFQELRLYRDGRARTFQDGPNSALQNSHNASLGQDALAAVQRKLEGLDLSGYSASSGSEPAGLHTVLIYFDGRAYQRRNINGPLPPGIQAVIDSVQAAFKVEDPDAFQKLVKAQDAAREAERKLRAGGWNVPKQLQLSPLNVPGLLLTVGGVRGDAPTSIYHVLVFYPEGKLSYEPRDPANWGPANPHATVTLRFEHPNGPSGIGIKTVTRELVIDYRLIENTLNVGTHSFPLPEGNLFVIQLADKNWTPLVRAVHAHIDGPSAPQAILEKFKAQLNDAAIQSLRLGG
ncbi:MAG TPA: hypothetical protein VFR18_17600 [Terriglobia bacterium]|nr:hypothetical protein [Terriglobia bacterium]